MNHIRLLSNDGALRPLLLKPLQLISWIGRPNGLEPGLDSLMGLTAS
jgi:hypothetical protein